MIHALTIRPAQPDDVLTVFQLIYALADYEKLTQEVVGNEALLQQHLFGDRPFCHALLAELDGIPAGFALYFDNYSVSQLTPGLYLEDLFVLPAHRGLGIGKQLLIHLARHLEAQQGGQLQWCVLDWNAPAIAFYQRMGAVIRADDRVCRLVGDALRQAAHPSGSPTVRFAMPEDAPVLVALMLASGELGCAPDAAVERLEWHLTGPAPRLEAVVLEADGKAIAAAPFFHSYSTFLTRPGLFVDRWMLAPSTDASVALPQLVQALAAIALERACGRLEWLVAVDQTAAIQHYQALGATVMEDWRFCDVVGEAIARLAQLAV